MTTEAWIISIVIFFNASFRWRHKAVATKLIWFDNKEQYNELPQKLQTYKTTVL